MSTGLHALDIWLGDVLVGRLSIRPEKAGRCDFRFHDAYRRSYPRPVLGQAFEDDLGASYFHRARLPAFFANLLPEGALRAMVQRQIRKRDRHEIHLLAAVGEDLPGAVRATPPDTAPPDSPDAAREDIEGAAQRLRFALSGVQLKMSVLKERDDRLTVPASGLGGDWIVKFPHAGFPDLPENEHAMMTWASLSGIHVPEPKLVPVSAIDNLPPAFRELGDLAYAIPRFDRTPHEGRVHMEDFAQVLSCYPDDKYEGLSYERLAILSRGLTDPAGFEETLRRLVFMAAIGNGDAHMKNWSLLYPDGVTPRVSPAYDLVSTLRYPRLDDALAMPLHRSTRWADISIASFDRIADAAEEPRDAVRALVGQTVERIVAALPEARERSRFAREGWERILEHWRRVPLFQGRAP